MRMDVGRNSVEGSSVLTSQQAVDDTTVPPPAEFGQPMPLS